MSLRAFSHEERCATCGYAWLAHQLRIFGDTNNACGRFDPIRPKNPPPKRKERLDLRYMHTAPGAQWHVVPYRFGDRFMVALCLRRPELDGLGWLRPDKAGAARDGPPTRVCKRCQQKFIELQENGTYA